MSDELRTKTPQLFPGCLLADEGDLGTMLAKVGGDSKQQRPGSSHHNAFAADWQAGLHQSLHSASAHHIRQRPSRERQESLPGSGRQHESAITKFEDVIRTFGEEYAGLRLVKDSFPAEENHTSSFHAFNPGAGFCGM